MKNTLRMELRKLLDKIWELVESNKLNGDDIPDLDTCERELQVLIQAYAEKKIKDDAN
ncbi:MAG: hypothetical protein KDH96_00310 [Candidatus Riesia sp.]|nr:hypothetical protein [Candidatus Riesia sp.]